MKTILVALDFESQTNRLINYASSLAKAYEAKIYLIHITQPEPDFIGYAPGPQSERDFRAKELRNEHRYLQDLQKQLEKEGVNCQAFLLPGNTVESILEESLKLKADIIIAGTHAHSFMYNAFIGSTSAELFRKTKIPFLGIPLQDD